MQVANPNDIVLWQKAPQRRHKVGGAAQEERQEGPAWALPYWVACSFLVLRRTLATR